MSQLSDAIQEMRNMREAYDDLLNTSEVFSPELSAGKTALATAITAKGVTTAATDTMVQMADNVSQIAQSPIEVDGGEIYAKQLFGALETPCYWNLYDVMIALLNNTNPSEFGGILLGEYFKGYDSLAFGGNGAPSAGTGGGYVFSDEFSVAQDGTVSFTIHRADETHYWNDDADCKGNRWVAWLFAGESHGFAISNTNTCPRSIHIGRHVGIIESTVAGRISEIVVTDGNTLDGFKTGTYTQNLSGRIVLRNIAKIEGLVQQWDDKVSGIYTDADSYNVISYRPLSSVIVCPRSGMLVTDGRLIDYNPSSGSTGELIIKAEKIQITNGDVVFCYGSIDKIILLGLEETQFNMYGLGAANETLKYIYIGYSTNNKSKSVTLKSWSQVLTVENIEVQNGWCKPLDISYYSSLTEANMYAHILQRLKQDEEDCGDGVTITLGSTNLAKLTSEASVALLNSLTNTYGYTFA